MRLSDPGQLADVLGVPFSGQQLAAITAPLAPGVIIAGAGSGKTTVMAARVVWLVGSGQVCPEQVLGLTFTRKAAGELGARVRTALLKAGVLEGDGEAGEELVLTYDAFAARLVAEHGLLLGIESDARLITSAARFRLAARVVSETAGLQHLSRLRPAAVAQRVLELAAELRSNLVDPEAVSGHGERFVAALTAAPRNPRGAEYAALQQARAVVAERRELLELVNRYERLKTELGYVEFADQMAAAARLAVEVPAVPASLRREFAVVLLDEYQDTSAAQAKLLRALFSGATPQSGRGHPVTAVGDPCQAIYGWRGAAASNILDFATSFPDGSGNPAQGYALTVNRRSGQRVLDAANRLATGVRSDPALVAHGLELDLVAPPATPPGRVVAAAFGTWPDELAALVARITALHDAGEVSSWSQIAVLARRNVQVAEVYAALRAEDVPAEIVGLGGLLELPPVAEVVATLTVLDDPGANPAMIRLLTSTRWAIGLPDLARLGRRARELAGERPTPASDGEPVTAAAELRQLLAGADAAASPSLAEAVADPGPGAYSDAARERLRRFAAELRLLRRHSGDPVTELVARVIAVLGLPVELAAAGEPDHALAAFVQAVAAYTDIDADASLSGLLAYLEAEREYGNGLEQAVPSSADSVKVLTVHKAKGLEWEAVFIPGLADEVFPTDRVSGNWLRNAATLPYPLRGDATALPQLRVVDNDHFTEFAADLRVEQRLSEDRLAYVAVTRARRLLVGSTHVWSGTLIRPRRASGYFEVLAEHAQEVVRAEDPAVENPLLGPAVVAAWPVAGAGESFRRRVAAAAAVTAARRRDVTTLAAAQAAELDPDQRELIRAWRDRAEALVAIEAELTGGVLPHPDYLSVTGLGRLVQDPDGFAAELRRPMPRLVSDAQRWGIAFHAWLERRFASQAPLLDADDRDLAGAEFERLRAGFEAGPYATAVPLAVETPFTLVLAGRLVRGRIDAVFAGPDGRPQVVDWKTGDAHHADPLQLACYRLAWAELNGLAVEAVDAVFYDLHSARVVRPPGLLDRAGLERLLAGLPASLSG